MHLFDRRSLYNSPSRHLTNMVGFQHEQCSVGNFPNPENYEASGTINVTSLMILGK